MIHRALLSFPGVACLALAIGTHAGAADAPRSLAELAGKRELWPPEVTILEGAQFQNGRRVREGQVVALDEVRRDGLRLDDGAMFFLYAPERTDFMQRVEALYDSLSPEQRALTLDEVRRRQELWPVRATLRWGISMDGGAKIPAGRDLVVMGFQPNGQVLVADVEQNITVPVDPWFTDLFGRARDRVGQDESMPFRFRLLESMLEPSADGSTLADYDYVVVYDGKDTCSRSTAFAPELAKFQQQAAADKASWTLVLMNGAMKPPTNRAHYRNMGLEGRIVKDGWGPAVDRALGIAGYSTPWVTVYDATAQEVAVAGEPADSAGQVLNFLVKRVR